MANQIPFTINTEEAILQAVRLRATRDGVTLSEAANAILRKALAVEIQEVTGVQPLAAAITVVMNGKKANTGRGPVAP
jgi:hypothetical protein